MFLSLLGLLVALSFVQSANILVIGTIPSISHQVVFQPIWRELSLRGHQVTVFTPDPLLDPKLTNLTEIDLHDAYSFIEQFHLSELMSKDANKFLFVPVFYNYIQSLTEFELNNGQFRRMLTNKSIKFDVILVEAFDPTWHALSYIYDAPIIGMSSLGVPIPQHDSVGNPTHPVLYPDMFFNVQEDLSFFERTHSFLYSMWFRLYYYYAVVPHADKLARTVFGNQIPYIGRLEKNVRMWFFNVNPFLHSVRPNVPAVVQLGQMHLKPVKPLPKDLQDILDSATEGVVYFSLGSNVKSAGLSDSLRDTILEAFSDLPYRVLWKWEKDHLAGKSENIITRKWLPQQDVLAHPNVKVFITQGGLQSIEEAISRGVPMVGVPFMADQPTNVQRLSKLGIGVGLDSNSLTKDKLIEAIMEVAGNAKYRQKIKEIRDLMNDQPMTGLERAIWWTEYFIRHKDAQHLRSPAVDVPWYYYYMLDILGVLFVTSIIVLISLKVIVRTLLSVIFTKKLKTL